MKINANIPQPPSKGPKLDLPYLIEKVRREVVPEPCDKESSISDAIKVLRAEIKERKHGLKSSVKWLPIDDSIISEGSGISPIQILQNAILKAGGEEHLASSLNRDPRIVFRWKTGERLDEKAVKTLWKYLFPL